MPAAFPQLRTNQPTNRHADFPACKLKIAMNKEDFRESVCLTLS